MAKVDLGCSFIINVWVIICHKRACKLAQIWQDAAEKFEATTVIPVRSEKFIDTKELQRLLKNVEVDWMH